MHKISIVLNLYMPNNEVLLKILGKLKDQIVKEKIELVVVDKKTTLETKNLLKKFHAESKNLKIKTIKVNENLSFASSMNEGIRATEGDIVVVLQQDCILTNENWLEVLCNPFSDKRVVATVSKVRFPDRLWKELTLLAKAIMLQEKGTITPLLDEKGCAYRKKDILAVGLFNDRDYQTAGEDFDMYLSLKKRGIIAYPDATIIHYHPTNFRSRMKKVEQYANGYGTLVRIKGKEMPRWYVGMIKALPVIGIGAFLLSFPFKKGISLFLFYVILTPALNYLYMKGFWRGYLQGKQSIDVFK